MSFFSCVDTGNQRVEEIVYDRSFYEKALVVVQDKYERNPSDDLLRQKLYYLKQLGWPSTSFQSLQEAQSRFGLTEEIVRNLAEYYAANQQYLELDELLEDWDRYSDLSSELSQIRIRVSRLRNPAATDSLLSVYRSLFDGVMDLEYLQEQFLIQNDTTKSREVLLSLAKKDPTSRLIDQALIPILLQNGEDSLALGILQNKVTFTSNQTTTLLLAKVSRSIGLDTAKVILRNENTIASDELLVDWFEEEGSYDSAVFYLANLIQKDSSRDRVFRLGDLYEKRYWLKSAYFYFNTIAERDTLDSVAYQRAEKVGKKIAYLRSLEERKRNLPLPELNSKKSLQDE